VCVCARVRVCVCVCVCVCTCVCVHVCVRECVSVCVEGGVFMFCLLQSMCVRRVYGVSTFRKHDLALNALNMHFLSNSLLTNFV